MRILYLVTKADLGGAQVHILDLLRGFQNAIDPMVAAGEEGYFTEAVRKMRIPCCIVPHLVHAMNPMKDCRALVAIARLIRALHVDVVHAPTSKAGVVGRLAARAAGGPSLFTDRPRCFAVRTSCKFGQVGVHTAPSC